MAKLTEDVQAFIVQRLACFDRPSQVAAAVKEEFGLEITRQQVETYDADRAGKKPAAKWVALFNATRKRFDEHVDDTPASKKAVRIRRLDRMAAAAEDMGNLALAAQLLEQIAKEMGGAFTNRRELTGKDGGPIEHDVTLTEEERAVRAAGLLQRARDRKAAAGNATPNATPNATGSTKEPAK